MSFKNQKKLDKKYLDLAISLSKGPDPSPNPRVGALIVKDDLILGSGHHHGPGTPHAEIEAITDAISNGNSKLLKGATLYVSLEPCSHTLKRTPPCTDAILKSGIDRVVFGMKDPNSLVSGAVFLRSKGVSVAGPLSQKECEKINSTYLRMLKIPPRVILKMAMSLDGKIATRENDSKWISSEKSRLMVHHLRSRCDAILVGAGTVIADNPRLTSRIPSGKDPIRVIIDGSLSTSPKSNVFQNPDGKTILVTCASSRAKLKLYSSPNLRTLVFPGKKVDLRLLLTSLSAMGLKSLLLEGGSTLAGEFFDANLIDEFYFFICPKLIGGKTAKSPLGGLGLANVCESPRLHSITYRKVGPDLLIHGTILRS
ncbi:bifunctional diaminohydroxyphosphoribosylaminopyrimidine deaminase/5-amino-6-(5-phosphoribosylamino)uracil reductase RibD [Candidatus Micrarchaeota archaeon]|nr:bifunctional diaminohydroxyphosphoribosylaminopyrimidine deaminase/5-amino-6-(5-phosphoribosylamino)uracil reductase RibD [Candidatus Micrarchaeota archaeon]